MHSSPCFVRSTDYTAFHMLLVCAGFAETLISKLSKVCGLSPGAKAVQCCP